MAHSHPELVAAARAALAMTLTSGRRRILVGVAGPPAAGKSTLAASLTTSLRHEFGQDAAVAVSMDGFHLANARLVALGLAGRKGAPETFDAAGFVALLGRLREPDGQIVYAPAYSRVVHESIGSAVPVAPGVRTVVIEGNYLLLQSPPWDQVRPLLDVCLYVDAATPVRVNALLRRQRVRGLSDEAAQDWVHRSDEVNAVLIESTRHLADHIIARPA